MSGVFDMKMTVMDLLDGEMTLSVIGEIIFIFLSTYSLTTNCCRQQWCSCWDLSREVYQNILSPLSMKNPLPQNRFWLVLLKYSKATGIKGCSFCVPLMVTDSLKQFCRKVWDSTYSSCAEKTNCTVVILTTAHSNKCWAVIIWFS